MTQPFCERHQGLPRWSRLVSLWLCVCGLPGAVLAQAPAFLVKDIDMQPVTGSSNPRGFTAAGGTTFFITDTDTGNALWTTDGTERGTVRVKDFNTGSGGLSPYVAAAAHGTALLVAWDDSSGYELWASDGTERGTQRLADINPGPGSSWPNAFTEVEGSLFFVAINGTSATELWKTDGTSRGTLRVADTAFSWATGLIDLGGTLFFVADDQLWKSDGTSTGTMRVTDLPGNLSTLWVSDGKLLIVTFSSAGFSLWESDGTAAGTVLLKSSLSPDTPAAVNGTLFFTVWNDSNGVELWKSDGTPAGTVSLKDFREGPVLGTLTAVNGSLFFTVQNGVTGVELWKSDGTSPGTVLVQEIPGSGQSVQLSAVNGLLFVLVQSADSIELWRSDGTAGGTVPLVSSPGYVDYLFDPNFTDVDGRLFLVLRDQLWTSDGTPVGTVRLTTSNASALASANGQLLFAGYDARTGFEPWKSDGTSAGTMLIANLAPDSTTDTLGSSPSSLTDVDGTLFFLADDGVHGMELWRSNATAVGTALVKDINPGPAPAFGYQTGYLTPVNDTLFFVADDGTRRGELWRSDGTEPGTVQLTHISPGSSQALSALTVVGGSLFFLNGPELWVSDGTELGTVELADFGALVGSTPSALTEANGVLFFLTSDSDGAQLWRSDGSATGTIPAVAFPGADFANGSATLAAVNSTLFIVTPRADGGYYGRNVELWKSDGSAAGSALVKTIERANDWGTTADQLTAVDDMLFFVTHTYLGYPPESPQVPVLWQSDGTAAGTVPIASLSPTYSAQLFLTPFDGGLAYAEYEGALFVAEPAATGPALVKDLGAQSPIVAEDGRLLFQACASTMNDCGLWESDGTADGTRRLAAVSGGAPTVAGAFAFFSGASDSSGSELWAVPLTSLGRCGNGALDPGETCDTAGASATCEADCRAPTCGDGIANHAAGEECDDGNTQNGDCCSATCTSEPAGSVCSDGSACNGEETCDGAGECQPGSPLPAGTACGDGNVCNGDEACDGNGACQSGTLLACDDGNPYTADSCDPSSGCLHTPIPGPTGDCNGDGVVSVNELVAMVSDALGEPPVLSCPAGDANLDHRITVDEIIAATKNALTAPCDLCDDP